MRTKYATVKDVDGLVYELQESWLVQPYQLEIFEGSDSMMKVRRCVTRKAVSTSAAILYTVYEGETFIYRIDIDVYKGRLSVGCREFNRSATKKILDWAKRKPAKKVKREVTSGSK